MKTHASNPFKNNWNGDAFLTINSIRIFVKKTTNAINMIDVLPKSSYTTSKTIFKTLSALATCHVSIILSSCCNKYQNFDYGCSSYPGKEA